MPQPITPVDLARLATLPPAQVVAFFKSKGHAISWDWREVWKDEHARAFTVAKAARTDILQVLRDGVESAIANGWSERRFLDELTPKLQALGWWGKQTVINPTGNLQLVQLGSPWRLKTIYRTNMYTSFARGRYAILAANKENRPFWLYDAKNDERTRETHRALDNKVWPADHPIWKRIYPPSGFNCRCMIRALTAEQVAERGLKIETGDEALPAGFPDEGWNFNPAEQRIDQLAARIAPKSITRPAPAIGQDAANIAATLLQGESVAGPISIFSTAKNVTAGRMKEILDSVPGAEAQRNKLYAFLDRHKTATVFGAKTEISSSATSYRNAKWQAVQARFVEYLTPRSTHTRLTARGRFNGYTYEQSNVVAVVAPKGFKFSDAIKGEDLRDAVSKVIATRNANDLSASFRGRQYHWTFSSSRAYSSRTVGAPAFDESAEKVLTWLHEIGHQIHFKGGTVSVPRNIDHLTVYSTYNSKEWFAEHFVGWLLDRDAMYRWSREAVEFIDSVVDRALKADNRTLPGGVKP